VLDRHINGNGRKVPDVRLTTGLLIPRNAYTAHGAIVADRARILRAIHRHYLLCSTWFSQEETIVRDYSLIDMAAIEGNLA
jgi:hypothetical protein